MAIKQECAKRKMQAVHIHAGNRKEIEKLYLHDGLFTGFDYDYLEKTVRFACIQMHTGMRHDLAFKGIRDLDMRACGFWGEGNAIYGIGLDDEDKLEAYRRINRENPVFSSAWQEEELVPIEIQLNSGDRLSIVCRSLDICSRSFEWTELICPYMEKRQWGFYAELVCTQADEALSGQLPRLLEWLQDLNWPGALRIARRLQKMDEKSLRPALEAVCKRAKEDNDEEWLNNLYEVFGGIIP